MKRIFTHLFVAVLLMLSTTSWAQTTLEAGKVYRIVCAGTNSVSLGATALTDVAAVSTNETDKLQQWYVTVDGSNYMFRNLANGRYLQGNNGTSEEWGLTKESNNFTVTTENGNYCIRQTGHSNSYAYMHKDGGNNIVSWNTGAENSQWTPIEVAYTDAELQNIWSAVDALVVPDATVAGYSTALDAIFTDKACTQLNSTYSAKTVDQIKADANYLALPATLQAMVLKVKGGDWSEANAVNGKDGWSSDYAKRFRVQMYEPYSIEGEITSYLRINAHCNMDNPTGIYANADEAIYIMVDGDIADGAELWVAHQAGLGATSYYNNIAHFQLKKGLNVVPYFNDASTLWINYVVHTYNSAGATIAEKFPENRKLSKYKPLKIHIEGGHINGYYNAIGDFRATDSGTEDLWGAVDNDEDWNYYKVRAPLNGTDAPNRDFPLLGHRQTLLFPLGQQANADGGMEEGLLYHLDNITVPTTPNCYGGSGNTFGTFDGSYPGMGLSTSKGKINIMLEAWDRIMYSELATFGVVSKSTMGKMNALYPRWTSEGTPAEIYDYNNASSLDGKTYQEFCNGVDYSEYFNHHGCGVGAPSGYMSGGWRVCNYHYNTMGSIIGSIAAEAGPTWGPAHEIGHQHQQVFNLNGQTEVTNNFFSNVAVWYMGMGTSRVNGNEGSLESVLAAFNTEDNDLYTNNIWAITHMYYRLWLYYHLAGNNTQFWPRLFELCRQVPLENGGQISGETSLLRFYQHACDAAGEDLTEFFRAHGFFEVMDNRLVGDYTNATYNVTPEQIDAAIATVKAKKYPVNYAVLLINDGTSVTTPKHDGSTSRALWDNNPTAELGSVNDFIDGDIDALTNYTATVSADGTVTMSGGQGGAGFLVLNDKGELVSFSNKSTFTLNEEAKYLLASGKGSVLTVNSESETVEAEIDLTPMQKAMLESFIADVEAMPIDDGSYRHIGFYTKASAADLLAALESAKTILEAGNGGYAAAYEILHAEKEKFLANSASATFVPFDPSLTYTITSYAYGNTMHLNSGVKVSASADKSANTAKWQFKATSTDGVYKIYCLSNYYLTAASKSTLLTVISEQESAAAYTLAATNKVGAWTITTSQTSTAGYGSLHDDSYGKVVGWTSDADASKWYLTAIEGSTNNLATSATDELQALVTKTEALVNEVATLKMPGTVKYTLQRDNASAAYYISSNAGHNTEDGNASGYTDGAGIRGLLDEDPETYFHSRWGGTNVSGNHYLQIDLGEDNEMQRFIFEYATRKGSNSNQTSPAPTAIEVYAGNNTSNMGSAIASYTKDADNLPAYTNLGGSWTSPVITAGSASRYLRFTVTSATGPGGSNLKYFAMGTFKLYNGDYVFDELKPGYELVGEDYVKNALNAVAQAKSAIETSTGVDDAKTALLAAYEALYNASSTDVATKKAELQALISATKELLNSAGSITTTENEELALQVTNASGAYYLSTNSQENAANRNISKLVDGVTNNSDSYFHTNWQTSVGADHHLLLDMGADKTLGEFTFKYTTRNNNAGIDAPRTIVVEGSNDNSEFAQIAELTGLPTGQHQTYESAVLGNKATGYRYIRFRVTNGAGKVGNYYYFAMSEFDVTAIGGTTVTIKEEYKTKVTEDLFVATNSKVVDAETLMNNTTSTELLDAQIAELTAAKEALEAAMTAQPELDKDALQSLYDLALSLYNKMADENGAIKADYTPSALTAEMLAAAKTALDAALDALENATTQATIDDAKTALQTQYEALLEIENDNVNISDSFDKSELNTAIENTNTLIATINANLGYYEYVAGLGLAELGYALQNAQTAATRFYLTEAQYNTALTALNTCLSATQTVINADCADRTELTTLIANVNSLLSTIAEEREVTVALPLQSTNADEAYYIWCSDPAGDSNGVAGLIDKNADGTANTGTFLGTNWSAEVPAYTHYIEIDLGVAGTIDQLTMDYTTRDHSDYANQRPNAIKILGSNDKENYTPITEITEGLATGQTEKWTMTAPVELGAHYRYIRIAVGSEKGFFHMSDFNLYTVVSSLELMDYYTTAEGLDLATLCLALDEAQDAAARYMTTEQYTAVYNNLNGCYTAANDIVEADYTDREALSELVTEATTLVNDVVEIDETETVIALQATDANAPYYIYCNAPGATNNYSGDNLGVAALLDVDDSGEPITATFLHTSYVAGSHDDNLDHYLRVDMDESNLLSFKFRYTPRIGNTGNAPLVMLIEGCNNLENGEWEEITTLSDMATTYQSDEITNGKAYRYIRFMVKDTHNHSAYNGRKFFAMSHFEMTACKTVAVDAEHQSPYLPVGVLSAAYNELADAQVFDADYYFPSEEGEVIKSELQTAYDALVKAVEYCWLPVKLTTDENNPVLYTINAIGRGDGKGWQYNMDNNNVTIVNKDAANFYHLWYFVAGDAEHTVKIVPVMTPAYRLECSDYGNGANKVNAGEYGVEWEFYRTATDEYNFKPTGQNTYLSNYGGSSNPLGFYGSVDGGSKVNFTEVVVEDYGLNRLRSFANSLTPVASGTTVGSFVQETGEIFNQELAGSLGMVEDANYGNDAYAASFVNLFNAYHNLEVIMPQAGTENAPVLYTITNVGRVGGKMFAGGETEPVLCWDNNDVTAKYVFTFEPTDEKGKYYMRSLERGTYVSTAHGHGSGIEKIAADKDNAKIVTIANMSSGSRAVSITPAGGAMLHADGSGNANKVVAWNNNEANNASAWLIDEVTDLSQVAHTVTMNATFSSVMLGYNATVPAGVEAYNAEGVEDGYVSLVEVARAGEVIPANTPVILYRTDGNTSKTFTYTTTAAVVPTETVLGGSLYQKFVECDVDKDYYKLMIKGGEAKMYWMYKEFNAEGVSQGSTNDGGHIKCSANKIYMALPSQQQAASFGMRFKEPETTGAEEVKTENGEVKTIYDLQGRKLTEITEPGFYIINGKKVYVK